MVITKQSIARNSPPLWWALPLLGPAERGLVWMFWPHDRRVATTGKQFGNRSSVLCVLPKVVASAPSRTVARRPGFQKV